MARRREPEHYEPAESPIGNPLHPEHSSNPAVRLFTTEFDLLGTGANGTFPVNFSLSTTTLHFQLDEGTVRAVDGVSYELRRGRIEELGGTATVNAVNGVSYTLAEGETLAIRSRIAEYL